LPAWSSRALNCTRGQVSATAFVYLHVGF
jgi:hypothetical protein